MNDFDRYKNWLVPQYGLANVEEAPPVGWGKNKPTVFPACRKRRLNGGI